jgi:hypothetical protein
MKSNVGVSAEQPRGIFNKVMANAAPPDFSSIQGSISVALGLLQLLHNLIEAKARRLLAWRELLERGNELCNSGLRRHHNRRQLET